MADSPNNSKASIRPSLRRQVEKQASLVLKLWLMIRVLNESRCIKTKKNAKFQAEEMHSQTIPAIDADKLVRKKYSAYCSHSYHGLEEDELEIDCLRCITFIPRWPLNSSVVFVFVQGICQGSRPHRANYCPFPLPHLFEHLSSWSGWKWHIFRRVFQASR